MRAKNFNGDFFLKFQISTYIVKVPSIITNRAVDTCGGIDGKNIALVWAGSSYQIDWKQEYQKNI